VAAAVTLTLRCVSMWRKMTTIVSLVAESRAVLIALKGRGHGKGHIFTWALSGADWTRSVAKVKHEAIVRSTAAFAWYEKHFPKRGAGRSSQTFNPEGIGESG